METLIVVCLLALSDKDPQFRERLNSVLAFYRENRELFKALAEEKPAPQEAQKNPPENEGEGLRLLEAFLKKV